MGIVGCDTSAVYAVMSTRADEPNKAIYRMHLRAGEPSRRDFETGSQAVFQRSACFLGADVVSLGGADLAAGHAWVLRIGGKSRVRIHPVHSPAPPPSDRRDRRCLRGGLGCCRSARLHLSDSRCTQPSRLSACNAAIVRAADDSVIYAYDDSVVRASGRAQVTATDTAYVHLCEDAHAWAERGVRITGPSRANAYLLSADDLVFRSASELNCAGLP